jgi:predicted MFS family arabinose efflux permease
MAGEVGTHLFYNVYLDDGLGVSTARIGLIVSAALLLAGLVTLAMPVLANRWGNGRTTIMAMTGMTLFLLPLALIAHWLVAAIAFICFMALASISRSTLLVYRMGAVAPVWWAAMSGAAVTGQGVGETAFLFGGGFLIDTVGYKSFFLAAAGIILIGTLIFWIFHRSPHSKAVASPVGIIE